MTSQWAEEHPLDVDAYIEQVAQKHGADVERVRLFFNYGLGKKGEAWATHCPAKHRDKVKKDPKTGIGILTMGQWPEYVNGCEPALIEAWNKAGEYHTKGLRLGDVLPEQTPACKITRLEDGGWIALFPKDAHLLTTTQPVEPRTEAECHTDITENTEMVVDEPQQEPQPEPKPEPRQLDLFAMQASPRPRRHAAAVAAASPAVCIEQTDELQGLKNIGKALAIVIGLSAVLVVLWQTGLIIPLGLIGLGISGFLR
jgi:hypothetical protein